MQVLARLQQVLETLHHAPSGLDVSDYLVDEATRREIPGARAGLPEQLFVRQFGDDVEIALYVDDGVLAKLERHNPFEALHAENLESYAVALEGVSHFVLLAWRASHERTVSALELEIQAEIDKFVVTWLLLSQQGQPLSLTAKPLLRRLFESYVLRDDVPAEESDRYHVASRVARGYCERLRRCYDRTRDVKRIRQAVRRFYRKGLAEKLRAA